MIFSPIHNGLFWGCSWMGGAKKAPPPKIYHTYPTIMKLSTVIPYLKKIQKHMNRVKHPVSSAEISIFSPEIIKFSYIKK